MQSRMENWMRYRPDTFLRAIGNNMGLEPLSRFQLFLNGCFPACAFGRTGKAIRGVSR
jgi:hypothetical protein